MFPAPLGLRSAYLFPFSDQVFFPKTLGARTALAGLALDPPWLAPTLALLVRLRGAAVLARRRGDRGPAQRLDQVAPGEVRRPRLVRPDG